MEKPHEQFVRIQDNQSSLRKAFLKKWFANNYDGLRFYCFLGEMTRIPIIGRFLIRPTMETYYRNFEPGSLILPGKEIEAVINSSSHLSIDPCICRIFNHNCDTPLYTCLKINFAAKVRQEQTGRAITKQEALEIVKDARKRGLILALEHCLRPYHYNICMCCTCCCVPIQLRQKFGLDIYNSGPYAPVPDEQNCQLCRECEQRCPVSAISADNGKIGVDLEKCLGCGVCEDSCPNDAITMKKNRTIHRNESEPSALNLFLKRIYLELVLIPQVLMFKLLKGSQQYKAEQAEPRETDVYRKAFSPRQNADNGQSAQGQSY